MVGPEAQFLQCFFLFADDTKIVSVVHNKMQLEKEIENFIIWSRDNRLNFNFEKFKNGQFSLLKNQKIKKTTLQRLGRIFFRKFIMGLSFLSFGALKADQKLAYLKRSIPSETELSVKGN